MGSLSMPIEIRGRRYKSAAAAARALNLSPSTISSHLNRGTLENAGMGRGFGASHKTSNGLRKQIVMGGRIFPSYSALSRFMGMSDGYVAEAMRRKQYDRIIKAFMRAVEKERAAAARKALDDTISS